MEWAGTQASALMIWYERVLASVVTYDAIKWEGPSIGCDAMRCEGLDVCRYAMKWGPSAKNKSEYVSQNVDTRTYTQQSNFRHLQK